MDIDNATLKALEYFEGEDPLEGPTPEEVKLFLAKRGYIGLTGYDCGVNGRDAALLGWFEAKSALYALADYLEANPSTKSC